MINVNDQIKLMEFISENTVNRTQNIINESTTSALSDAVLDKIFTLTIGKYNKIDFSDIERTRGDITRFKYYDNLKDCIAVLTDLHTSTDKIPGALTVSIALENILNLKSAFERAFRVKNQIAIVIYNTYVYSVMEATSYLIATSVDFVKSEIDNSEFTVNIYTDSKQNMIIEQLVKLNKCVDDGTLVKFIGESEKSGEEIETSNESAIGDFAASAFKTAASKIITHKKGIVIGAGVTVLVLLAVNIVPIIRELIYWIYRCRQKISDAAMLQAEFLEANIKILRANDANDKIIAKQEKHVARFKKIAKAFAVDGDKASRDANKDINEEKVDASSIVI